MNDLFQSLWYKLLFNIKFLCMGNIKTILEFFIIYILGFLETNGAEFYWTILLSYSVHSISTRESAEVKISFYLLHIIFLNYGSFQVQGWRTARPGCTVHRLTILEKTGRYTKDSSAVVSIYIYTLMTTL